MFVDEVRLKVIGGKGGDGCTAFRREKYVPDGGPDGGNGGRGSDIIFKVDEGLKTLLDLRYNKLIKGKKGQNGSGKSQTGKNAEDITIKVPLGTIIKDNDTNLIIADLTKKNAEVVVASGGRGGRGNKAFASTTNTAPEFSEYGEPGEERNIHVELKLLADVGLVGMPSVGKSTFLSKVSAAKPKIAEYHFTTLSPNLGVVKTKDQRTFVIADLPGLIEGASKGDGLGIQFLKHIERTKVIAHIIDMSGIEGRNPYEDYLKINNELELFNESLLKKQQIIIANKMDIESSQQNLVKFKDKVKYPIYEISAINNMGVGKVLIELANHVDNVPDSKIHEEDDFEKHVLYKFKKEAPFTIEKEGNIWIVKGETVEKLFKMTKFSTEEGIRRFAKKIRIMGIDDKLIEMGAKPGDTVKILDVELEFQL